MPKFDEWRKSDCTKGMTGGEYEEFMRIHEPEYTIDKHVKTKYLFVKCRITFLGGGSKEQDLNDNYVFALRGYEQMSERFDCYFDHTQNSYEEPYFFRYRFNKVGDSVECVLGRRFTNEHTELQDDVAYYIGLPPSAFDSSIGFNYKKMYGELYFAISDLPKEK